MAGTQVTQQPITPESSSVWSFRLLLVCLATVFWHLRSDQLWPRWLGTLLVGAALTNLFLLLEGRTGYAVTLTVLCLSVMWKMRKHLRLSVGIAAPIILLLGFFAGSAQVHERLSLQVHESESYANQSGNEGSSGWLLNASNPHQEYLLWGVELGLLMALGFKNQPTLSNLTKSAPY